jgi:hypothetical protein
MGGYRALLLCGVLVLGGVLWGQSTAGVSGTVNPGKHNFHLIAVNQTGAAASLDITLTTQSSNGLIFVVTDLDGKASDSPDSMVSGGTVLAAGTDSKSLSLPARSGTFYVLVQVDTYPFGQGLATYNGQVSVAPGSLSSEGPIAVDVFRLGVQNLFNRALFFRGDLRGSGTYRTTMELDYGASSSTADIGITVSAVNNVSRARLLDMTPSPPAVLYENTDVYLLDEHESVTTPSYNMQREFRFDLDYTRSERAHFMMFLSSNVEIVNLSTVDLESGGSDDDDSCSIGPGGGLPGVLLAAAVLAATLRRRTTAEI